MMETVTDNARAEAWDEGCLAGMEWQQSGPAGIPHDPPPNPYRAAGRAETTTGCEHGGELIRKFDGGRSAILCEKCYLILGYMRPAGRAETTTEATERIARQIAATTAMTGLDAREYVKAAQAIQRAETTTATDEDARALLAEIEWAVEDYRKVYAEPHPLPPNLALAVRAAGLLASPLPGRDQIRTLHRPVEIESGSTICHECSFQLPNGRYFGKVVEHPCPTLDALEGDEQ